MPERKTIIITVASIIIVALVVLGVFMVKQRGEVLPEQRQEFPLIADKTAIQLQTQEITLRGKDNDCESIASEEYKLICHEFFKNQKETTPVVEKFEISSSSKEFEKSQPELFKLIMQNVATTSIKKK